MQRFLSRLTVFCLLSLTVPGAAALATELATETKTVSLPGNLRLPTRMQARDTLSPQVTAATADQQVCLAGICWSPEEFPVTLQIPEAVTEKTTAPTTAEAGPVLLRFPSPVVSRWPENNLVAMECYFAAGSETDSTPRPAVVVVHESGRKMPVGRLFARSFQKQGYHAFLLHLPGYGARQWGKRPEAPELLVLLRQGIADVRRAHDAVAALPIVDEQAVFLHGTSLGGIVSSTVAGVDHGFAGTFLMLAGGDLYSILQNGDKDAAKMREEFRKAGMTEDDLKELVNTIEPLRLAARINADRLWLYTGRYDDVIPLSNAVTLARTAGLPSEHHIVMAADHYSGILYFPAVMKHMDQQIQQVLQSRDNP